MHTRKIEIARYLNELGKTVLPPGDSQDPFDALLHELDIAQTITSIGEKRKEAAKDAVTAAFSDAERAQIDKLIADTKTLNVGSTTNIIDAKNNGLDVQTKNGASFLNQTKLKNELSKRFGAQVADQLIAECTEKREPSKSYIVVEYGDK